MKHQKQPVLGTCVSGDDECVVTIDVDRLVDSRLVISAMSGAGKSHAVRRILEQTHGKVQHIVIDPEGEFYTLRDKFSYVLAGVEGDCPADPASAGLLAIKLLEVRVSTIIDLYELPPDRRHAFVKAFIDALLNAPKTLRHPCLVVIDEAHVFAPEKGEGESVARNSVINLMATGRKRLLCPILATQRFSKLDKNAVSEAHNLMIGKSILDIDVARSMKYLGFGRNSEEKIRRMQRGHFWTFGPAFTDDEVSDILVGDTLTQTPKLGSRAKKPAPPTSEIQKALRQLSDIPEEAAKKAETEKDLRAEIAELKKSLRAAPAIIHSVPVEKIVDKVVYRPKSILTKRDAKSIRDCEKRLAILIPALYKAAGVHEALRERLRTLTDVVAAEKAVVPKTFADIFPKPLSIYSNTKPKDVTKPKDTLPKQPTRTVTTNGTGEEGSLDRMRRSMLIALAQNTNGLSKGQILLHSGYASSGPTSTAFADLARLGYMEGPPFRITAPGLEALGPYDALPQGSALLNHLLSGDKLSTMEKALLRAISESSPSPIAKGKILENAGYKSSGPVSTAFARLVRYGYAKASNGGLVLSSDLQD